MRTGQLCKFAEFSRCSIGHFLRIEHMKTDKNLIKKLLPYIFEAAQQKGWVVFDGVEGKGLGR